MSDDRRVPPVRKRQPGGLQVPERYLLPEGVAVVVPRRVASLIYGRTGLGQVRQQVRGADPEVDAVLMALHIAALQWRGSADAGTTEPERDSEPEPAARWLSTGDAAAELAVTDRAIRKAIAEGRLTASLVAGKWRIAREDLEHYRAARNAA